MKTDKELNTNKDCKDLIKKQHRSKFSCIISAIIKRFFDIIISLIGCIIMIPVSIVIKIANLISGDRGPIFYTQDRIGKNGEIFKMYKYRSMVTNADEILNDILKDKDLKAEWDEFHKLENDPRITKVGKVLRVTSIDEFPQLLNVLKGDMAIVGNRPYLVREKEDMGSYYDDIIKTKPGMTGIWQVSGRSDISFDDRLDLESNYSRNNSLINDLKILGKTIKAVFKRKGSK